ncbi:MAG TPA: O-antigen ligase family protein [Candidatus Thermoplasmatota archaeon]|nr:O-antigen ligase family protein [Candidatus Thermoplasmatota archaeon]
MTPRQRVASHIAALRVPAALALALLLPLHFTAVAPGGWGLTLSAGDLFVAAAIVVMSASIARQLRASPPVLVGPVLALLGAAALSLMVGVASGYVLDVGRGVVDLIKLVGAVAWALATWALLRGDRSATRALLRGLTFGGIALAGWAIVRSLAGDARPVTTFTNPNLFANFLAAACAALLATEAMDGTPQRRRSAWKGLCAGILLAGLVATASRGMLLGVVVAAVAALPLVFRRTKALKTLAPGASVALLVLAAYVVAAPDPASRISRAVEEVTPGEGEEPERKDVGHRMVLWKAALRAFLEYPLLGAGIGQAALHLEPIVGTPTVVHNTYLSMAAELGVLGLAAGAWLILSAGFQLRAFAQREWGAAVALSCYFIASLVQGLFTNIENFRAFWVLAGVLVALAPRQDAEKTHL